MFVSPLRESNSGPLPYQGSALPLSQGSIFLRRINYFLRVLGFVEGILRRPLLISENNGSSKYGCSDKNTKDGCSLGVFLGYYFFDRILVALMINTTKASFSALGVSGAFVGEEAEYHQPKNNGDYKHGSREEYCHTALFVHFGMKWLKIKKRDGKPFKKH